jgi:hypothetical protein
MKYETLTLHWHLCPLGYYHVQCGVIGLHFRNEHDVLEFLRGTEEPGYLPHFQEPVAVSRGCFLPLTPEQSAQIAVHLASAAQSGASLLQAA